MIRFKSSWLKKICDEIVAGDFAIIEIYTLELYFSLLYLQGLEIDIRVRKCLSRERLFQLANLLLNFDIYYLVSLCYKDNAFYKYLY